jgi:hypothetical protein
LHFALLLHLSEFTTENLTCWLLVSTFLIRNVVEAGGRAGEMSRAGGAVVAEGLQVLLLLQLCFVRGRLAPCLVPTVLPQILLCKKKIPRHIKMSANA